MKFNIQGLSNKFINIFFVFLGILSILGAASLLRNDLSELSGKMVLAIDIAIIGIVLIIPLRKDFKRLDNKVTYLLALTALFIWQCWIVMTMTSITKWDPTLILYKAIGHPIWDRNYFSIYPNNLFLLSAEHFLWLIFGKPELVLFTKELGFLNIFLLDSSILFLGRILRNNYGKRLSNFYILASLLLIGCSPWITIPYSDIWAFCVSSLNMSIVLLLTHQENTKLKTSILTGFLSLLLVVSYFLKPTLVIFYIALLIISLLQFVKGERRMSIRVVSLFVILIVAFFAAFSFYKKNTNLVSVDENKSFSLFHFAAMGISGRGGYNPQDTFKDKSIKNYENRKNRDLRVLKKRFNKMGPTAYERFLMNKQIYNTEDGTFTWGNEADTTMVDKSLSKTLPRRLFTVKNRASRTNSFSVVMQVIWLLTLLFMVFTCFNEEWMVQLLKYTVIGFFFFLLLFEGGRSRYVIQFLPFIILLASFGFDNFISKYVRKNNQLATNLDK